MDLSLYVEGKSLGAAARSVPKNSHPDTGRIPERSTVLRWMQRAQKATTKIPENIPIRAGGKWCTDEIHFRINKGGSYMAGVMNAESGTCLQTSRIQKMTNSRSMTPPRCSNGQQILQRQPQAFS